MVELPQLLKSQQTAKSFTFHLMPPPESQIRKKKKKKGHTRTVIRVSATGTQSQVMSYRNCAGGLSPPGEPTDPLPASSSLTAGHSPRQRCGRGCDSSEDSAQGVSAPVPGRGRNRRKPGGFPPKSSSGSSAFTPRTTDGGAAREGCIRQLPSCPRHPGRGGSGY